MRARAGMTLIELVIALTITGFAVSGGYAAFATLADRRAMADARADEVARGVAVRSTITSWLSSARLTIEEDEIVFRGIDGVHREASGDQPDADLTFFTSARTPLGDGGTIVHLFVRRDSADHGLVAELSERSGARSLRVTLDSAVGGMRAEYLSSVLGSPGWTTSWVSTTILPAGARLTLLPRRGDSLAAMLRPMMTVSLENGR